MRNEFNVKYIEYSASKDKIYTEYVICYMNLCMGIMQDIGSKFRVCVDEFHKFIADEFKKQSLDKSAWDIQTAYTLTWMYTVNTICGIKELPSTTEKADVDKMNKWINDNILKIYRHINVSSCVY